MDITQPITAAQRLNALYGEAQRIYSLLLEASEGDILNLHPDVKFWFDQMRRIASELAKISTTEQIAANDAQIQLLKTFLNNSKLLPPSDREKIAAAFIRRYNSE